jgi:hypothetical protein
MNVGLESSGGLERVSVKCYREIQLCEVKKGRLLL